MELDLQSLFGLHVYSCSHSLRTLLVSQDIRHLLGTPCLGGRWGGMGGGGGGVDVEKWMNMF